MIEFKRKNRITAVDVEFKTVVWEYVCWVLAGKPEKIKKNEKKA